MYEHLEWCLVQSVCSPRWLNKKKGISFVNVLLWYDTFNKTFLWPHTVRVYEEPLHSLQGLQKGEGVQGSSHGDCPARRVCGRGPATFQVRAWASILHGLPSPEFPLLACGPFHESSVGLWLGKYLSEWKLEINQDIHVILKADP